MHDDDLVSLMEVCLHYITHTGAPNSHLSRQDDNAIPEEDELLRRLRIKYTPVTSSIPRGNFPSIPKDADEPRELLPGCHCVGLFFGALHFLFSRSMHENQSDITHPQSPLAL
jgi:hypothetical protein